MSDALKTKDEILKDLESKGIILCIDDKYILTEKYKDFSAIPQLVVQDAPPEPLDYERLLDGKRAGRGWPVGVAENTGRKRFGCFMDVCDIPITAEKGYRLRSADKPSINILDNIVDDISICPNTMIDAIKLYYKYTEMPKSFKNLVVDGDILDLYEEHTKGLLKPSLIGNVDKSNQQWS